MRDLEWPVAILRSNRWYASGVVCITALSFSLPHVLGFFIPCAQFMEVEWAFVALACLAGLGALNILWSLASGVEVALPPRGVFPVRAFVLVGLPLLVLLGAAWLAFEPFLYGLLNDPELLCD